MGRSVVEIKATVMDPSLIAFSPEGPLLAAGSLSGTGGLPWLSILRTAPGFPRKDPNLLDYAVAGLDGMPASFGRLSWSKAAANGSSSCPAGLLAGGLESGQVAVWDPRQALRDMECFYPEEERFAHNLEQEGTWLSRDFTIIDDYFSADKTWEPPAREPLLDQTCVNLMRTAGSGSAPLDNRPVALFGSHNSLVRGLAFSPLSPNLLGSGAGNGTVNVHDLAKISAENVPTWKAKAMDGMDISFLSWSPRLPNIVGATSSSGVSVWDIRSRSQISVSQFPRRCSALHFSPFDDDTLVVSSEDYTDKPALSVWDLRKMEVPLAEMCEYTKGIVAMAWSPEQEDALLVSTRNDHLLLCNVPTQEVIWSGETLWRVHDVDWSRSTRGLFAAASSKDVTLYSLK